MLFHLKEPDYKKEAPSDIPTRFYSRDPNHIFTLLNYYRENAIRQGTDMKRRDLVWWLKKEFSNLDIEQVERGEFSYFAGMISFKDRDPNSPLFEELKINDEFDIYVPIDNILQFSFYRASLLEKRRCDLYKLQSPIEMFRNISYVPEDIARNIIKYDLSRYIDAINKNIEFREQLSQHPNIKVDGLGKALKKIAVKEQTRKN